MRILLVAFALFVSSLSAHAGEAFDLGDAPALVTAACEACTEPCGAADQHQADHAGNPCHECESPGVFALVVVGDVAPMHSWGLPLLLLPEDAECVPGCKPPIA